MEIRQVSVNRDRPPFPPSDSLPLYQISNPNTTSIACQGASRHPPTTDPVRRRAIPPSDSLPLTEIPIQRPPHRRFPSSASLPSGPAASHPFPQTPFPRYTFILTQRPSPVGALPVFRQPPPRGNREPSLPSDSLPFSNKSPYNVHRL